MTNVKRLADKIRELVLSWDNDITDPVLWDKRIEPLLREATERKPEDCDHAGVCDDCIDKFYKAGEAYARGRAEAIFLAAEVINRFTEPDSAQRKLIAAAIERLKEEK